jgi:hypothetical protein
MAYTEIPKSPEASISQWDMLTTHSGGAERRIEITKGS